MLRSLALFNKNEIEVIFEEILVQLIGLDKEFRF